MKALNPVPLKMLFLAFLLPLISACSSLLYYPTRGLYVDPQKLSPVPENQEFTLGDGLKVHGWFFRAKSPAKGTILFFHGNGQNRSAHFFTLYWLISEGYNLAIFDYPGYGQTGGSPSPRNTVEMAQRAIRKTAELSGQTPLIVYGQSLGGAIAMRAVWELRNEIKPRMLIVDSSFLSYQKAARKLMARSAWTWLLQPLAWVLFSDRWAPGERLGDLDGVPVLVIHSRQDEIIPFSLGEEVFASAREPKTFWPKQRGSHNQTYGDPEGLSLKKKLLEALPH